MSKFTTREVLDMIEANHGPIGLDLAHRDLSGIDLSRAGVRAELEKMRRVNPETDPKWWSNLTRTVNLAGLKLDGANLQEAHFDYADLNTANLERAYLVGAHLEGALLPNASLERAVLVGADLRDAALMDSSLVEALLDGADFTGSILHGADLQGVDFLPAGSIEGAYFHRANLDRTQLTKKHLGAAIGEEVQGQWLYAKEAYLGLKNNFKQIGRYDDASWAYRKERRMEKREAWQLAKHSLRERKWGSFVQKGVKAASDLFVELICDYGEGIWQVVRAMLIVWILFACLYGAIWGVLGPEQWVGTELRREPTRDPVDMLLFSVGVTSRMAPGLKAQPIPAMRILMAVEAISGTVLAGLLGFVLGNRIRRS